MARAGRAAGDAAPDLSGAALPSAHSDPDLAGDPVVGRLEALATALTPSQERLADLEAALLDAVPAFPSTPQARAVGAGSAWAGFSWRRGARRSLVLGLTGAMLIVSVSLAATQTDSQIRTARTAVSHSTD